MYEQRLPIEEWKAKKQAELKETIAAQKSILQEVVQDGQRLADYLYGRGRLGSHITSGNAALVLQTLPQARAVLTAKDWDKFGRRVNKGAKGIPQLMRVNGYYNVGSIFDVSLTYGNKPYPIPEIKPEQMDKAIKELERLSPVNIIFQNEALSGTMPSNTRLCSQRPCRSVKCWHDCPPKSSLQPQSSTGRVSPKLPIYEKRRWQYRWNFVVGFLCRYPIPLPLFWTGWIPTFHPARNAKHWKKFGNCL